MCGIAAVINTSRKAKLVERGELKSMANAMIGRGPDAEGIWVSGDRGIGITCRRLSTQDPRALANQPAWNYDHSVVVVFNGEIYNHVEIRKELETRGYHFRTNNDAEVLANGFFAFGRHVLEKIRGQFSFVAFNRKNNEVLIARDPFGICPLYYTMHDEQLIVSSTVEAILKLERIPRKLDHQGVYDYLISNSMGWEKTFYKNISYLRSGFYLSFKRNEKPRKGRFYELSEGFFESNSGLSTEQWVEEIRHILFEAVKTSMLGDKEVGVYLSGGIDSVSIMSLIRRIFPDRVVKTFSAGFSHVMTGETVGEIDFARKMANHFNTIHHDVIVNENDILNDVGKFDTPPPNLINTIVKKMATMASENGVNVALSGEGSDEMFFGYDHFLAGIGFLNPEYNWMLKKYYLRGQYAASLDPETAEIVDVFRGGGADIDIDNNHDNLFTVNGFS